MNGEGLRKLRQRNEWSQAQLAEAINAVIPGRNYSSGSVSPWETGKRKIPDDVAAFLEELAIQTRLSPDDAPPIPLAGEPEGPAADTAPGGGQPADTAPAQPSLGSSGAMAVACKELWELIASGVGMVGAATGSVPMMNDGAIIQADSRALGEAWGRLAETNATFRKMLLGMTEGGVWLQVALVTGTTVSKCYQGHAQYALELQAHATMNGGGNGGDPADLRYDPEPA